MEGGLLLIAALAASTPNPEREWVTEDGSPAADNQGDAYALLGPVPLPAPASTADTPVVTPPSFDLAAAYGAIARVDLAACREQGLVGGYGRVAVSFGPSGAPVGVGVEMPSGSDPTAGTCVQRAFAQARVPAFHGAPARVHRSFYVSG